MNWMITTAMTAQATFATWQWIPNNATVNGHPEINDARVEEFVCSQASVTQQGGLFVLKLRLPATITGGQAQDVTFKQQGGLDQNGEYLMVGPVGTMTCEIDPTDLTSTNCDNLALTGLPGTTGMRTAFDDQNFSGTEIGSGMHTMSADLGGEPFGSLGFSTYSADTQWAMTYSGIYQSQYQTANGQWVQATMGLNYRGGFYHPAGNEGGLFQAVEYQNGVINMQWVFGPQGQQKGWVSFKPVSPTQLQGTWGNIQNNGQHGPVVGSWTATKIGN